MTDDGRSRRDLLRHAALAAGAVLAGCSGSDAPRSTLTPADVPSPTPTRRATDTPRPTEIPPSQAHTDPPETPSGETTPFYGTPPASETPAGHGEMPTRTDWPFYQHDRANTGRAPGVTAAPESATPYWQFYTRASAPVVADGTLYAAETARDRLLVARDAATGRVRWTGEVPHGAPGTAPAVDDERVYVLSYGRFHAFERSSGREAWSYGVGRGEPTAPVVVDDAVYVCNGSFSGSTAAVFALGAADGSERWTVELDGDLAGSLAADGDGLYVGTYAGGAGTVRALGFDGRERWRAELPAGVNATPAVADGTVYVHDMGGTLRALSAADGSERWRASVGDPVDGAAPAVDGETVYTGGSHGVYALSTADGSRRWRFDAAGPVLTPAVGERAVYFGTTGFEDRAVHAVSAESGDQRWKYRTDQQQITDYVVAGVYSPPTLVEGGLYVVAADGMYAFGRE